MLDYIKPFFNKLTTFAKQRMGFDRPPRLFLRHDKDNSNKIFGKTAFYDRDNESITIFVNDRHPKDILRSYAHELVHHAQNCRGDLQITGEMDKNYAQNNKHMRNMEKEAYLVGNMCFRDFEDSLQDKEIHVMQLAESVFLKENNKVKSKITKQKLKGMIRSLLNESLSKKQLLNEKYSIEDSIYGSVPNLSNFKSFREAYIEARYKLKVNFFRFKKPNLRYDIYHTDGSRKRHSAEEVRQKLEAAYPGETGSGRPKRNPAFRNIIDELEQMAKDDAQFKFSNVALSYEVHTEPEEVTPPIRARWGELFHQGKKFPSPLGTKDEESLASIKKVSNIFLKLAQDLDEVAEGDPRAFNTETLLAGGVKGLSIEKMQPLQRAAFFSVADEVASGNLNEFEKELFYLHAGRDEAPSTSYALADIRNVYPFITQHLTAFKAMNSDQRVAAIRGGNLPSGVSKPDTAVAKKPELEPVNFDDDSGVAGGEEKTKFSFDGTHVIATIEKDGKTYVGKKKSSSDSNVNRSAAEMRARSAMQRGQASDGPEPELEETTGVRERRAIADPDMSGRDVAKAETGGILDKLKKDSAKTAGKISRGSKSSEKEVDEAAKPDFPDVDGDGDREEPISKAQQDKKQKDGDDDKGKKSDKDLSKVPPQLRKHVKGKTSESKIQTPEQENTLYEQRFTPKNNRLYEKLLKQWAK